MVFEHNPGLAALHNYITNDKPKPSPIEETMAKEAAAKAELEEINKEFQEEARLKRPRRKGFGS